MPLESELLRQAAEGDIEAFEALVRQYEKQVYNTVLRICRHPDDAFDLSQEVFLRVWRHLADFREDSSLSTWIYRICNNLCLDHLRKKSRRREEPLKPDLTVLDGRADPQAALEKKELRQSIDAAMGKLSPEHRVILSLREVSGLSYAEIAAALDLEEGTVKSRLARARIQMRGLLKNGGNNFNLPPSN